LRRPGKLISKEASVAKKKNLWISETETTKSGRKKLDALKQAVQNALRSYVILRAAHGRFEIRMKELDDAAVHATIPKHYLTGLRRRV
jgi:hypothetical protein